MPNNRKDPQLQRDIFESIVNGNDTIDAVWLAVDRRCDRSTTRRYMEHLVKMGAVIVNREYAAHRYTAVGDIRNIVPDLEYILPRIEEYSAQKVPQLVNIMLQRYSQGKSTDDGIRDGRMFILLALAARSEDNTQLTKLCSEVVNKLRVAYMDYRLFDTIAKRGIDKTREAKKLFELGDMSAHEASVAFVNLYNEVFGGSNEQ